MLKGSYYLKHKEQATVIFLSLVIFTCLIKTYLSVLAANLDLIDGVFALFMDERVLYDGVYKILHPKNLGEFLYATFDANAHLYGRIFWNLNAVIGFVPEYFFGSKGLILSERASSVFFLSLSYFFFSITFLKSWVFRLISFSLLVNAPFSSYFMTMPKPEPIQLFFLSLFLFFSKKNQFALEKKSWFFLGLSIGTKVSILPLSLPIVAFSTYRSFSTLGLKKTIEGFSKMTAYILFGLSVAVPILLKQFLVSCFVYWAGTKTFRVKKRVKTMNDLSLVFAFLFGNAFYSFACKKFFDIKTGLYKWFAQTILNTGHGSDIADVGFFSWVNYFSTEFLSPNVFINTLLISFSFFLVFFYSKTSQTPRGLRIITEHAVKPRVLLFSGLSLFFVVFSTANRLWGFYLVPGFSLIILSLISISEIVFKDRHLAYSKVFFKKIRQKTVSVVFILFFLGVSLFLWFPQNLEKYKEMASRTHTEEYRLNYKTLLEIEEAFISLSIEKKRKLNVKNIGSPFVPDNNDAFSIIGLERPFTQWWAGYEVLLVKNLRDVSIEKINPNLLNYDLRVIEKEGYNKKVIEPGSSCNFPPCYGRIKTFENGTELLVLLEKDNEEKKGKDEKHQPR